MLTYSGISDFGWKKWHTSHLTQSEHSERWNHCYETDKEDIKFRNQIIAVMKLLAVLFPLQPYQVHVVIYMTNHSAFPSAENKGKI
jgi:hypothetical protein